MKCENKESYTSLKSAGLNTRFKVVKVHENLGLNMLRRLGDLGIVEGTEISVLKKSFLGETLLVSLNGYTLSFRDNIAKIIEVKKVG